MAVVTLLGIAQDGGRPQPGCTRLCCENLGSEDIRSPVSMSIQTSGGKTILVEATRDLGRQLRFIGTPFVDHLILTHAHLGHVDGLGLFGRETMSARNIQLHCSPSMQSLVKRTPAWNQLLKQSVFQFASFPRIEIDDVAVEFHKVPHRDELSDTHAIIVRGKTKSILFLSDHDTWRETLDAYKCETIREFLAKLNVDIALLDGTFWSGDELQGRDMNVVPHPTVQESLERLGMRLKNDPQIVFFHFNHTNLLHNTDSEEYSILKELGWDVGFETQQFTL